MKVTGVHKVDHNWNLPKYLSPDFYPTKDDISSIEEMFDRILDSDDTSCPKREKQFGRKDIFA